MKQTPWKKRIFLFIFCFVQVWGAAQHLHLRQYTGKQGLSSSFVQCIYQDSSGYLWFGTDNGLNRFDGLTFKNYYKSSGLPSNSINGIIQDPSGNIWVSLQENGVSRINAKGIKSYTTRDGLPHNQVFNLYIDKQGHPWFATVNGICRFDGRKFETFTTSGGLPSNLVYCIEKDANGKIWVGTQKGPAVFDNGKFITNTMSRQLEKLFILRILHDSKGRSWFGTPRGLYMSRGKEITFYDTRHGLGDPCITSLLEDSTGQIWAGTWNGLARFDGNKFTTYSMKNGLPGNLICDLYLDREGNQWIATDKGVCRLNTTNVLSYSTENGLPENTVMDIIEDQKGRCWAGTTSGLARFDPGGITVFTTKNGLPHNYICNLCAGQDGAVWIATRAGLSRFENGAFSNYTTRQGLTHDRVFEVFQDRRGITWVGMQGDIQQIENLAVLPPIKNAPSISALDIIDDPNGNVWFATMEGLYKYDGSTFTQFTKRDGLPDQCTNFLHWDSRDRLWIATDAGLARFQNGTFKTFTTRDGLPDNNCSFVIEGRKGEMWIGTSDGLASFDGTRFKTYTMKSHDLVSRAWETGFKDSKGILWIGSNDGVTRFSLPPFPENTTPPPIYLTGVNVMDKQIPMDLDKKLELKYNQNYLRFNYTGISFTAPQSLIYKYRIDQLDTDWETTSNRSIFYPYLPPGDYTFYVTAVNSDGYESTAPASFKFTILPPYWKTWWFQSLLIVAGSTLIGFFFFWRFRRAKEREIFNAQQRELEAKNQQLVMSQRMELLGTLAAGAVHDLKNLLAVIIGYSRIAAREKDSEDKPDSSITHIQNTANSAVNVVSQILAFTRQQYNTTLNVNLPDLIDETLDTLKVNTPDEIDIQWQRPEEPILIKINPTRFQQVVMNLCLNAFHAMPGGGSLAIAMEQKPGQSIQITFADNGTGIPEDILPKIFQPMFTTKSEKEGTGLGLFVVKQIVEQSNGTIDVQSTLNKGTTFTVTL